jgi:endonuclease/exonuclease/phosphatase family metal-dependent hydrolase
MGRRDRAGRRAGDRRRHAGWLGDREPAIRLLRGAFPDTPPLATGATWIGPLGVRASLDYVFARGLRSVRVQRLPDRFASDHYPLLAAISF